MEDFEYAKDKVVMGVERKTLMLTDEEKTTTAYHEAGHALVAAFLPGTDPLHKVTIIPRGRALGLTQQLPTEDKHTYKQSFVQSQIAMLMGGRVAEELTQEGDITTGAGNDIERTTQLARKMVCDWGMSRLGPLALGNQEEPVFIGRDYQQRSTYSEATAVEIDKEVGRLVNEGLDKARKILGEYREVLERIARELLERESLEGYEVYDIIEEMTGQDLAPESTRRRKQQLQKIDDEPKPTPAESPTEEDEEEDAGPDLASGSLPSPAGA